MTTFTQDERIQLAHTALDARLLNGLFHLINFGSAWFRVDRSRTYVGSDGTVQIIVQRVVQNEDERRRLMLPAIETDFARCTVSELVGRAIR